VASNHLPVHYINIWYMVEQECLAHMLFAETLYADCALFGINV